MELVFLPPSPTHHRPLLATITCKSRIPHFPSATHTTSPKMGNFPSWPLLPIMLHIVSIPTPDPQSPTRRPEARHMQAMKFPENAHGWSYSVPAGLARSTLQAAAFGVLDLLAPAQVDGAEVFDHLPCPVLLAANHTSHLDTLALLRALPRHFRKHVAVAAAGDYFFANPWSGAAVTLCLNAFPFARASSAGAVRAGLEYCAGLLDSGWSVLLFPEGTRSLTGDIGRFRSGVGMLAA